MTFQTGIPVVDWFLALLDAWGYLIVFGFTVFENLFVVGSFTPGETVVIAAAFVASREQLFLTGVWGASVIGTVLGSNVSYWLGRRVGLETVSEFVRRISLTRAGRLLRVQPGSIEDVYEHFHTEGAKTILISRFAVGAKNFVPAVAGATGMPAYWFEIYTLLGAIAYTSLMCGIGWFVGENLERALAVVRSVGIAGLLLLATFVASAVYARRRIRARRAARVKGDAVPALSSQLSELVQHAFWHRIEGGNETGSTNDDARELASKGAEEGTVVVAAEQSSGRGRHGRVWSSPEGGAYISAVLRPPADTGELSTLSLAIALGVVRGLEAIGVPASLKWPNDVRVEGRKVAGVLLETSFEPGAEWVVAGVGLNAVAPAEQEPSAAYLSQYVPDITAASAAAVVLDRIAETYLEWREHGFSAVRAEFESRHDLVDRDVVVRDTAGVEVARGRCRGIDDHGFLLIESDGEVRAFNSGDVTLAG